MKIKEINVQGFGRLEGFKWRPAPGFNLIYGCNEAGKSTLVSFVLAMLYGLNDRKNKILLEDPRRRYQPWGGGTFGGSLLIEHDGIEYRINREFGSTKAKDSKQVFREATNQQVSLSKDQEPGNWLLGMSESEFLNSVFIAQMQSVIGKDDDIKAKLLQLSSGSGPKAAPEQMTAKLTEYRRDHFIKNHDSSRDRRLRREIQQKETELDQALKDEAVRQRLRQEIRDLKEKISCLEKSRRIVSLGLAAEEKLRQDGELASILEEAKQIREGEVKLGETALQLGPAAEEETVKHAGQLLTDWESKARQMDTQSSQMERYRAALEKMKPEDELQASLSALQALDRQLSDLSTVQHRLEVDGEKEKQAYQEMLAERKSALKSLESALGTLELEQKRDQDQLNNEEAFLRRDLKEEEQKETDLKTAHNSQLERKQNEAAALTRQIKEYSEKLAAAEASLAEYRQEKEKYTLEVQKHDSACRDAQALREGEETKIRTAASEWNDSAASGSDFPAGKLPVMALAGLGIFVLFLILGLVFSNLAGFFWVVAALGLAAGIYGFISRRSQKPAGPVKTGQPHDPEANLKLLRQLESSSLQQLEGSQSSLRTAERRLQAAEGEREQTAAKLNELRQIAEKLNRELSDLQSRNLDSILAGTREKQAQIRQALADLENGKQKLSSDYEARRDELTGQIQKAKEEIDSFAFSESPELRDRKMTWLEAKTDIEKSLAELGIFDQDRIQAEMQRLSSQLGERKSYELYLAETQTALEETAEALQQAKDGLDSVLGARLNLENPLLCRESYENLLQSIQEIKQARRELENRKKNLAGRLGGLHLEEEEVGAARAEIQKWLEENEEAVSLLSEYGRMPLEDQLSDLNEASQNSHAKLGALQNSLDQLERAVVQPPVLEKEIEALKAELEEVNFQAEAIEKAIRLIQDSDLEMRQSFGPQIDGKTREYLEQLTGESISQLKVTSGFDVSLAGGGSLIREKDFFSKGKVDQIYLALRLTISETLYNSQKLPFFFDDILVQYDSDRGRRTFDFLQQHCSEQERQVFFITCHEHIQDYGHKAGAAVFRLDERIRAEEKENPETREETQAVS